MDKERQIRFLYPPLILICSIALGIWFDDSEELKVVIFKFIENGNNIKMIIALLGAGSLVLVLGFLLGTLTVFILRILFVKNGWNYEVKLSEESYKKIGKIILTNDNDLINENDRLYAGIVFDHGFLPKNIHQWIVRRWNSFFISTSSTIAIITSLFIGYFLNISLSFNWLLVAILFIIIFILQSRSSWKETMKMLEFMIRTKGIDNQGNTNGENTSDES